MALNDSETNVGLFSLEDAFDNLKDIRTEMTQVFQELVETCINNSVDTIKSDAVQDQVRSDHHRLMKGLLENLHHQEPRILPHPNTMDLYMSIIQVFKNVVQDVKKVINTIVNTDRTKKNIARLESNQVGLEKMTSACHEAIENVGAHPTYSKEMTITKQLFNKVKADLHDCVDAIFPDNTGFNDLLADLTQAYAKGGDDVYIDVKPEALVFAKFLIEADIAVYHRNDKRKIRMTDLV